MKCLLPTSLMVLGFSLWGATFGAGPGFAQETGGAFSNVEIRGDVAARGDELVVKGRQATFVVGKGESATYRLDVEFVLAPAGVPVYLQLQPADVDNLAAAGGLLRIAITRDREGRILTAASSSFDAETNKWSSNRDTVRYTFWPASNDTRGLKALEGSGLEPRSWYDRPLRLQIDSQADGFNVWLEGLLIKRVERPAGSEGTAALQFASGDRLQRLQTVPLSGNPLYLPIDLSGLANDRFATPIETPITNNAGVPFQMPQGKFDHLNLRQAGWTEAATDPSSYYERYDAGPAVLFDPRMPYVRVPVADYAAAHFLAVADEGADVTNRFTLQAGRYGYSGQVVHYDFFSEAPRAGETGSAAARPVAAAKGRLFHIRVPLDSAFAQDIEHFIEMTLTKEIRLARRKPDPARFRYRPLGLPSGVRIAAMTLERSPLQLRVGSQETGHAFVEPQKPEFQATLSNISTSEQAFTLRFRATHLDGTTTQVEQPGSVGAGETIEVRVEVPTEKRGYHDLEVTLVDARRRALLTRRTSFALLPPDTRQYRAQSPFGTWDFCGGHFTSNDPDEVGPLYVKMGLRYGMFNFPEEARAKYGVLPGSEYQAVPKAAEGFAETLAKKPDSLPYALLYHEHSISGPHVTRVPDLFHDFPRYKLDPAENERFQKMMQDAIAAAKSMREKYPQVHLRLGNGPLPLKEEMLRHKFPAELFDSSGNESASFGRPPEAQPPDYIANNASVWMDRRLLDAYGYSDKEVTQCYEICYPSTNPGNLDPRTQADYFVRHAMHALAWGIKEFRPGCISDMGNSYYYSNWGSCGFCRRKPELNVKPAFVAFATMTRVLDGAKFVRKLEMGSESLYGMEFQLPDGRHAYSLWTLRGKRPVQLALNGGDWTVIDDQANESPLEIQEGAATVTLTTSPQYLVGKGAITAVEAGKPVYTEKPEGKPILLDPLNDLSSWTVEEGRNPELEFYNFMTPRRRGDFVFEAVSTFDGKKGAIRVTPQPIQHGKDTMPMYAVLDHAEGIPISGAPTEIGVWVHGNSGWGRVIFELTDASGQRWISLGAQQAGEATRWLEDMVPKEILDKFPAPAISDWNTEDVFGHSRINFDGWRWVGFPLPGNYPGENFGWPANSQWRWDKDGVVHCPLTFRKLIVELPEKVLHVTDWKPVARPEIYLRELSAGQGDTQRLKTTVSD